jgi:methyltransferase (TIGR00027 family)
MDSVSLTAYYCCGIRMDDAERPHPICGDRYAKVFMNDEGRQVHDSFKDERYPNGSNVTRHRIIDDLLRDRLLEDAARPILVLGAGFDTRAFRLKGGRWTEVDEQALITYKNARLPSSGSPNPLERVAVDFSTDWLPGVLERYRGAGRVTIVIEGVLIYLEPKQISKLLETLHRRLPDHELICDLITRRFVERYSHKIHKRIAALGATFRFIDEDPEGFISNLGYQRTRRISIVERAAALKAIPLPRFVVRTFLRTLRRGLSVCVFERTGHAATRKPSVPARLA